MGPFIYHASMPIPCVLANDMSLCLYHESKISITEVQKYKLRKRKIIIITGGEKVVRNKDIQMTGIQKYKLQIVFLVPMV